MSDSVQRAYRFLVARFKKPEGNASATASHGDTTTASTSSQTNTETSTAPSEPAESTNGGGPLEASTSTVVGEGEELVVSAVAVPGTGGSANTNSTVQTSTELNDPSDTSTSDVAEVQISNPSVSITDRPVSEDGPTRDGNQRPSGNGNSSVSNSTTLSRSIAVTMNLTVNVRHHNHHHRHHLPPVHFIGAMDDQMQTAHGQHGQHAPIGPIGPIGVGFIDPVNPLLARARHRLYSLLLLRAAMAYFLAIPPLFRKCFEYSVLATAISAFALLIHLHVSLIRSPLTCLDQVADSWPRDGILRVQISMAKESPFDASIDCGKYISEEALTDPLNGTTTNTAAAAAITTTYPLPLSYSQWRAQMDQEQAMRKHLQYCPGSSSLLSSSAANLVSTSERLTLRSQLNNSSLLKEADALRTLEFYPKKHGLWPQPYMVEYSLEYGLLRLSEEMRAHYNVPLKVVSLCPDEDACFGDPLARFILYHFLGYDDVLIGSIKRLAEKENNRGYVRNVATGEHFRFVNVWMTRASYIAAAFIMIVFTLFVSMLIRYSHQQVFVFVSEFLRTVEMQQPFSRITMLAASLITVVLALIGMEAIMFEFFNDSSIAFHVIIMVWAADQFDSMSRSATSKRHFLRFFYLYQFAFYAYHYRFNGQYAGLALMVTMLFTYHSMIFFFHHYELPLVQAMEEHIRFERRQRGSGGGGGGGGANGGSGTAGGVEPPREARSFDNGPAEGGEGSEGTTTSLDSPPSAQTSDSSTLTDSSSSVSLSRSSAAPLAPNPPPPPIPFASHPHFHPSLPPPPPHHHHHNHNHHNHHHHHFTIRHHMCTANRFPFGTMNATRRLPQELSADSSTPVPEVEID